MPAFMRTVDGDIKTVEEATLTELLVAAIDVYHANHPELSVQEVFDALDETSEVIEGLEATATGKWH